MLTSLESIGVGASIITLMRENTELRTVIQVYEVILFLHNIYFWEIEELSVKK